MISKSFKIINHSITHQKPSGLLTLPPVRWLARSQPHKVNTTMRRDAPPGHRTLQSLRLIAVAEPPLLLATKHLCIFCCVSSHQPISKCHKCASSIFFRPRLIGDTMISWLDRLISDVAFIMKMEDCVCVYNLVPSINSFQLS